ncbi:MAG TPA: 3-deoxy-D-manno-octulosonic acid transferase [Terriglobales bacterium]|nr:3-deoxy-D-manno-octulosonic acid transferase [Terriglobales bacterium]
MYFVYTVLLALALFLSLPYWLFRMIRDHKYRAGLGERFGKVPRRLTDPRARQGIWIHAVSVGEILAVTRLIGELKKSYPEHRVYISTTTDTGQKLARQRFGEEDVFYFPLDFPFAIRPYLKSLRPDLLVIVETEFWPNVLRLTSQHGARIAIVNARISDRSRRGYSFIGWITARVLSNVSVFLAQTDVDRQRLIEIGAPADRVQVSGNLKFDVAASEPPAIVASLRASFANTKAGPVIVAGSTMEGEEPLLLRAFEIVRGTHPRAVMILAPRHPQRFQTVVDLITFLGLPVLRRSLWSGEELAGTVLVLDTIGELAAVYALADLAFVGGSLVEYGGHNILEPAQYGVATLIGPHYENFRDMVNLFRATDAVRVVGPAELPLAFVELVSNRAEREALGKRGLATLHTQRGATQRTMQALRPLL